MAHSYIKILSKSERMAFSRSSDDWAVASTDGKIVVWDSSSGFPKQEFLPSSHLSSSCTCFAWMPPVQSGSKKKYRKRKSSVSSTNGINGFGDHGVAHREDELLALGTSSGSIVIYSLKTGEVVKNFSADKAHPSRINDIAWNYTCTEIFTASNDGFVGRLNLQKGTSVEKLRWSEGSKSESCHSVSVHPNDRSLLIGSLSKITWWDLDSRVPLKIIIGAHIGPVISLSVVAVSQEECFLFSAGGSEQDQSVVMWSLNLDTLAKKTGDSPVSQFGVNDSVNSVVVSSASPERIVIGVVTKSGSFLCFEHDRDGKPRKKKKPKKPMATVQVATDKSNTGKVNPIPILGAKFMESEGSLDIKIVHGLYVRPVFETLNYENLDSSTCLVREIPSLNATSQTPTNSSNLVVPKTTGTQVLAPGPSFTVGTAITRKRKISIGDKTETLAMVDRLRLLSSEVDQTATTPPRADSLIQLLLQGLNNQDRKILNSVLDRADEELIEKTVRKLPVESILPLITELQHYIKGRGIIHQSHSKWLRCVLQIHTAYLISTPACSSVLGPLYALLEARTRHHGAVLQLKGKLDMMTRQIVAPPEEEAWPKPSKEALLVYQDDSSDELTEAIDDLLLPSSDTEDIWQQEDVESSDADSSEEDDEQVEEIKISDESEEDDDDDDDDDKPIVNGNGGDICMDSDSS